MKSKMTAVACTLALGLAAARLGVAGEKVRQLFNGKDLSGWEHVGPGEFVVEDGLLKGIKGMGLLWYTKQKLGNCVLRVVYKLPTFKDNSGVFVRIADQPKDAWWAVHNGYEVQIGDAEKDQYHWTGAIYSLSAAKKAWKPVGEWNEYEITLDGKLIKIQLNGVVVNEFRSDQADIPERKHPWEPDRAPRRPEVGYIGLQNHDVSTIYFKEVSVRPLPKHKPTKTASLQ